MESFTLYYMQLKDNFFLVDAADAADTIRCVDAQSELNGTQYALTLESAMADGVAYRLHSVALYNDALGGPSKFQFTYREALATLLQSCAAAMRGAVIELAWSLSEIDEGVAFFVSRSENGESFVGLDAGPLVREGLGFTYMDSGIEPGKRYVYKVEYATGGARRLLFLSEEIRTPSAALSLDQNRPNPFNPSTTISFTLPAGSAVRLEIYDVSGRLVARLVGDERMSAGPHEVAWNGRDDSGRAASSGIYIYRLVAEKETLSRKMVLLR
jgi:hypothetical protein